MQHRPPCGGRYGSNHANTRSEGPYALRQFASRIVSAAQPDRPLSAGGSAMSETNNIEQEEVQVTIKEGHPALQVGDATIMLRTHFGGEPPQETEVDHNGKWPFFVLGFGEGYSDGVLEISPEFIGSDGIRDSSDPGPDPAKDGGEDA